MSFSERVGLVPQRVMQVASMDLALSNRIFNCFIVEFWNNLHLAIKNNFAIQITQNFLKMRIDQIGSSTSENYHLFFISYIENTWNNWTWNSVYDFIEKVIEYDELTQRGIDEKINKILIEEVAGYRIIDKKVVPIIEECEITAIEEAISTSSSNAVQDHLKRALELFSDKATPDYRNSTKESISAVEGMCRAILGKPTITLGTALDELLVKYDLQKEFKNIFEKLYIYTNAPVGVRHSKDDTVNVEITEKEAKFMLVACSAAVNYLKEKIIKQK